MDRLHRSDQLFAIAGAVVSTWRYPPRVVALDCHLPTSLQNYLMNSAVRDQVSR